MIHDIWVMLGSDAASRSALQHALCLADLYQSTVNGLILNPRREAVRVPAGAARAEAAFAPTSASIDSFESTDSVAEEFDAQCRLSGVGCQLCCANSEQRSARLEGLICRKVRRSELLCLGLDPSKTERPSRLLRNLMRVAPCPIWASFAGQPLPIASNVWVAYDGGRPADRALSRAATLASRMGVGIHLFSACDSARTAAFMQGRGRDLLRQANIPFSTSWRPGPAAETIATACREEGAELLFLGNSRRRLSRWLSAATAESVLASIAIPTCVCPAL